MLLNFRWNPKDNKDVEILWRLSRARFNQSKGVSDVEAKKMVSEGFEIIEEALKIDANHWAVHKWMAVLSDAKYANDGIKARLSNLNACKAHMLVSTSSYLISNFIRFNYIFKLHK